MDLRSHLQEDTYDDCNTLGRFFIQHSMLEIHSRHLKFIALREPSITKQFVPVQLGPAHEIALFSPHALSQVLLFSVPIKICIVVLSNLSRSLLFPNLNCDSLLSLTSYYCCNFFASLSLYLLLYFSKIFRILIFFVRYSRSDLLNIFLSQPHHEKTLSLKS